MGTFERKFHQGNGKVWMAALAILLSTDAFSIQISGVDTGSGQGPNLTTPVHAVALFAMSFVVLASRKYRVGVTVPQGPLAVLISLAIASVLWSQFPSSSIRIATDFTLTSLTFYAILLGCGGRVMCKAILLALIVGCTLSVIQAMAFPHLGIHQASEAIQAAHAGKWRGVYIHKNVLGSVAAVTLVLMLLIAPDLIERTLRHLGLVAALTCLIMAQSGTGFVITVAGLVLGKFVLDQDGKFRLIRTTLLLIITCTILFFAEDIEISVLQLLGKNATLSGRDVIWSASTGIWLNSPILGHGVGAFLMEPIKGILLAADPSHEVNHPHNFVLYLAGTLGIAGVVVAFVALLKGLQRAVTAPAEMSGEGKILALILVLWMLAGVAESYPPWTALGAFGIAALVCTGGLRAEGVVSDRQTSDTKICRSMI